MKYKNISDIYDNLYSEENKKMILRDSFALWKQQMEDLFKLYGADIFEFNVSFRDHGYQHLEQSFRQIIHFVYRDIKFAANIIWDFDEIVIYVPYSFYEIEIQDTVEASKQDTAEMFNLIDQLIEGSSELRKAAKMDKLRNENPGIDNFGLFETKKFQHIKPFIF